MKIISNCKHCKKEFEADTREIKRGNALFCSLTCSASSSNVNRPQYLHICKICNEEYNTTSKQSSFCSGSCKSKNYREKQKIRKYSIKTIYKLLKKIPCQLCGWKDTTRDIHHIIPVSKGGTNDISNLIVLCPNHHRMVHHDLISKEQLLEIVKTWTISSSSNEE